MSKTVTLRLDDETYEVFRAAASAQNRPLSNMIETAAMAQIRDEQFVDDHEMADILADRKLQSRLKKGSKAAARREGRFVE
jgi:predicted transcriptional regulator